MLFYVIQVTNLPNSRVFVSTNLWVTVQRHTRVTELLPNTAKTNIPQFRNTRITVSSGNLIHSCIGFAWLGFW